LFLRRRPRAVRQVGDARQQAGQPIDLPRQLARRRVKLQAVPALLEQREELAFRDLAPVDQPAEHAHLLGPALEEPPHGRTRHMLSENAVILGAPLRLGMARQGARCLLGVDHTSSPFHSSRVPLAQRDESHVAS
jgi:hypothetical protein